MPPRYTDRQHTTSAYIPGVGDGLLVTLDVADELATIAEDENIYNKLLQKSTVLNI